MGSRRGFKIGALGQMITYHHCGGSISWYIHLCIWVVVLYFISLFPNSILVCNVFCKEPDDGWELKCAGITVTLLCGLWMTSLDFFHGKRWSCVKDLYAPSRQISETGIGKPQLIATRSCLNAEIPQECVPQRELILVQVLSLTWKTNNQDKHLYNDQIK